LMESFISAHETWNQHCTCCIYFCVQCRSGAEWEIEHHSGICAVSWILSLHSEFYQNILIVWIKYNLPLF
jgi:hypothetical protein